jgi:4-amino-4-deoxy-L-arabinose transferase-like glycosyltransferase
MDPNDGQTSPWPDRAGWILIGALALLFCWNLGRVELSVTDEARSGVIVRDMVEGGRWLLPRTPDGYLCEKPLAYYGAAALLGSVFGVNEWTLRIVSVCMGVATLLMAWILARLYGPPRMARIAVIALASNVLFIVASRSAMVDMTLAFFLTAGLTAHFAARLGRIPAWTGALLAGVAFGLATLSKGPLGLVFPIAVAGGDALLEHRGRFWRSLVWWKQGLVTFVVAAAIACTWYVPGYLRGGMEFLETCILSENFRMPAGKAEGLGVSHSKSLLYYFGIQLAAVLPMLPVLPALLDWVKERAAGVAGRHLAAWLAFGFLLFEIPVNKRMYYLLPLQPALAVMIALAVERALVKRDPRVLRISSLIAGLLVLAAFLGAVALSVRPSLLAGVREATVAAALSQHRAGVASAAAGLLGVGGLLFYAARRGPEAVLLGGKALAVFVILARIGLGDRLEAEFDRSRPFVAAMIPKLPPGRAPVVLPPIHGYGIDFYWPGRLVHDENAAQSAEYEMVARPELYTLETSYETLGTWKYGPKGRDDILLIRKHPP